MRSTVSLNPTIADQITSLPGLALFLYGYALRLFFDFSGYSDIAIGIGILFGIRLPENFNRPYLKTNLTAFWQSWHATLSAWARAYVFSPLSRAMIKRKWNAVLNVLIAQLATMIVIGLWHGIAWNFLLWGVWHGFGVVRAQAVERPHPRVVSRPRGQARAEAGMDGVLVVRHLPLCGDRLAVVCAAARSNRADTVRRWRMMWSKLIRIAVKTAIFFVLCNLVYALVSPLDALGRVSVYNTLIPGRARLPYGENPTESS
ncbi:MAG: hypothetical protein IPO91_26555 [Chloroflexi bacterium]|nr:hypothetical protein [Chloroflexota bacterium]